MKTKSRVMEYFHFSRKESIAVLVLSGLILAVFFLPAVLSKNSSPAPITDTAWQASVEALIQQEKKTGEREYAYAEENSGTFSPERGVPAKQHGGNYELFYFDPNTITTEEWKKLGIRDKTIHTIMNYLSKGGKFRKPEDLQRIYGLFPDEYERVAPFIRIENTNIAAGNESYPAYNPSSREPAYIKPNSSRLSVIDINAADTSSLLPLPGIGGKLAARIISFRNKLGGFYSVDQVSETFGLPDSTFQKIKPYLRADAGAVKKININTATVDELKAHPYIRWAIANPLIAYRNEHGPFGSITDLKKVMAVTDAIYSKLEPYISIK